MAGPCTCRSPQQNFLPIGKNKLAGAYLGPAPTYGSYTPTSTPVMWYASIPAPVPYLAPTKFMAKYTDADLRKATILTLELFF